MRLLNLNQGRIVAQAVFDQEIPDLLALTVDPPSADIGLPVHKANRVAKCKGQEEWISLKKCLSFVFMMVLAQQSLKIGYSNFKPR